MWGPAFGVRVHERGGCPTFCWQRDEHLFTRWPFARNCHTIVERFLNVCLQVEECHKATKKQLPCRCAQILDIVLPSWTLANLAARLWLCARLSLQLTRGKPTFAGTSGHFVMSYVLGLLEQVSPSFQFMVRGPRRSPPTEVELASRRDPWNFAPVFCFVQRLHGMLRGLVFRITCWGTGVEKQENKRFKEVAHFPEAYGESGAGQFTAGSFSHKRSQ